MECTPAWKNGVQITAVGNIGSKSGYPTRYWTKHGKLPWVDYSGVTIVAGGAKTVSVTLKVLKRGDKGAQVKSAQVLLVNAGCGVGSYGCDGSFGRDTQNAVDKFQTAKKIPRTGVIDAHTWAALLGK